MVSFFENKIKRKLCELQRLKKKTFSCHRLKKNLCLLLWKCYANVNILDNNSEAAHYDIFHLFLFQKNLVPCILVYALNTADQSKPKLVTVKSDNKNALRLY